MLELRSVDLGSSRKLGFLNKYKIKMHLDFKVKFFSFDLSFLSNLEVILKESFMKDEDSSKMLGLPKPILDSLSFKLDEISDEKMPAMELIGPIRLPLKNQH